MEDLTKIQRFDLIQETYKYVSDHGIRADILVPKTDHEGPRPTIARFHGGGLVIADSLYMDWFPYWLSDLALEHEAVIVSANYRLMPQATGLDIYSDIADFWSWLQSPVVSNLLSNHTNPTELDLGHLLVTGESAGGLLSINSALHLANVLDTGISTDFTEPRTTPPFGQHTDEFVIKEYLAMEPKGPISSTPGDYLPLMLAAIEYGYLGSWYARDIEESSTPEILYPLDQLEYGTKIPEGGITIIQGLNDTVVPPDHSVPFVEKLREVTKGQVGHDEIQFVTHEGEHGFDGGLRLGEEGWLRQVLEPVVRAWLE